MDIYIVDEQDAVLDTKDVTKVDFESVTYRVSAVYLFNDAGDVLLAQRAFDKYTAPGAWGPSAAGMHEPGETYGSNIIKEIEEEIGLSYTLKELTTGPKLLKERSHPTRHYYIQFYAGICNAPAESLRLQEDEVADVQWFGIDALSEDLSAHPERFIDIHLDVIRAMRPGR